MTGSPRPIEVLLVEDNPGDIRLTREALKEGKVSNNLHVVNDGQEALAEIKSDPELCPIPVVILTSSSDDEDILKSYNLNANCYVTKPVDLDKFVTVVKAIDQFWFSIVTLPSDT